jgi:hypothetical protein
MISPVQRAEKLSVGKSRTLSALTPRIGFQSSQSKRMRMSERV